MRLIDEIGYENWHIVHRIQPMIDLMLYLNEEELKNMYKLGLDVQDKVYTEYEYDILKGEYLKYHIDDTMDEDEIAETTPLEPTGVSREDYNKIWERFEYIDKRYGKW